MSAARDPGTLTPPWTMGTGFGGFGTSVKGRRPAPNAHSGLDNVAPNGIATMSRPVGDVDHSAPRSDDEYPDPDMQFGMPGPARGPA